MKALVRLHNTNGDALAALIDVDLDTITGARTIVREFSFSYVALPVHCTLVQIVSDDLEELFDYTNIIPAPDKNEDDEHYVVEEEAEGELLVFSNLSSLILHTSDSYFDSQSLQLDEANNILPVMEEQCEECGKRVPAEQVIWDSENPFCSQECLQETARRQAQDDAFYSWAGGE